MFTPLSTTDDDHESSAGTSQTSNQSGGKQRLLSGVKAPKGGVSNASLLERIKATQQQKSKPGPMRSSSDITGYKAPAMGAPPASGDLQSVSSQNKETWAHPSDLAPFAVLKEDQDAQKDVENPNLDEPSTSECTPLSSESYNENTPPAFPTPAPLPPPEFDQQRTSKFQVESNVSSFTRGIQDSFMHFIRPAPSLSDSNASPLLSQESLEYGDVHENYSMKGYFVTFCTDMYGFTLGRLPVNARRAVIVAIVTLSLWLFIHLLRG